jgi:hypothetical protein
MDVHNIMFVALNVGSDGKGRKMPMLESNLKIYCNSHA